MFIMPELQWKSLSHKHHSLWKKNQNTQIHKHHIMTKQVLGNTLFEEKVSQIKCT